MSSEDSRGHARAVVFVGRRRGAFAAAKALGLKVVCVASAPPPFRVAAGIPFVHGDPGDPGVDWGAVAEQAADGRRIDAVFALSEASVVPAARLRRHLGLEGDSVEAAERATDKLLMKRAMVRAGIPCARFADASLGLGGGELIERLGLPLVVKDRVGSGGRGARVFLHRGELTGPLAAGRIAESFVDGVEMSVESLVFGGRVVFQNATEYFRVRWANIVPAELPASTLDAVSELNARVVAALGVECAFTHLELFLTSEGPVASELAARPPGGHLTELIELAYGFDPWQAWLRLGLGEDAAPFPTPARSAGVWLIHPGAGTVRSVRGVEQVRAVAGVEWVKLRVQTGSTVGERLGSGQEVGHLVVTGRDRDEVAQRLTRGRGCLSIEMESAAAG